MATVIVAAFAWLWANMEPIPYGMRTFLLIVFGFILGMLMLMPAANRASSRKKECGQKSAEK